jgi:hypothetical protein
MSAGGLYELVNKLGLDIDVDDDADNETKENFALGALIDNMLEIEPIDYKTSPFSKEYVDGWLCEVREDGVDFGCSYEYALDIYDALMRTTETIEIATNEYDMFNDDLAIKIGRRKKRRPMKTVSERNAIWTKGTINRLRSNNLLKNEHDTTILARSFVDYLTRRGMW